MSIRSVTTSTDLVAIVNMSINLTRFCCIETLEQSVSA